MLRKNVAVSQHQTTDLSHTGEMQELPPEKLPNPWLADSEWLLAELAKVRESVLRIPLDLEAFNDIKAAVDRCWNLEQQLRFLLRVHREGQRAFGKKSSTKASKDVQSVTTIISANGGIKA